MQYFTSDLHLSHKNILKYSAESRAMATDLTHMKELILSGINDTLTAGDELYILGDVTFGGIHELKEFLMAIRNDITIHLILGNHDQIFQKFPELTHYFKTVTNYKEIRINGKLVVMSHFPFVSWKNSCHGSYHLFGHCHGEFTHNGRAMDVGIDTRKDFKPWSWDEIIKILEPKPFKIHHDRMKVKEETNE